MTVRTYPSPEAFKQALEQRLRASAKTGGEFALYGQPFGVDVAFGEPLIGEPDVVVAEDLLGFAGIAPPTIRLYPIETHIAEKLHAYTMPRLRPNSRVKDLPDIALLATVQSLDARRLRRALEQTFTFRQTHQLPTVLPDPLPAWAAPYAAMAREDQLPWPTLDAVPEAAQALCGDSGYAEHRDRTKTDRARERRFRSGQLSITAGVLPPADMASAGGRPCSRH